MLINDIDFFLYEIIDEEIKKTKTKKEKLTSMDNELLLISKRNQKKEDILSDIKKSKKLKDIILNKDNEILNEIFDYLSLLNYIKQNKSINYVSLEDSELSKLKNKKLFLFNIKKFDQIKIINDISIIKKYIKEKLKEIEVSKIKYRFLKNKVILFLKEEENMTKIEELKEVSNFFKENLKIEENIKQLFIKKDINTKIINEEEIKQLIIDLEKNEIVNGYRILFNVLKYKVNLEKNELIQFLLDCNIEGDLINKLLLLKNTKSINELIDKKKYKTQLLINKKEKKDIDMQENKVIKNKY